MFHQPLILHRYQHRVRNAFARGNLQIARGVEFGHHVQAATIGERRHHERERRVRVKRGGDQRFLLGLAISRIGANGCMFPTHPARMDDALGGAGRSAGIDDVERVARGAADILRNRAFLCHPTIDIGRIGLGFVEHDGGERRQVFAGQIGALGRIDEQVHRHAIAQHRAQLPGRSRGRQRRRTAARPHGGQIGEGIAHGSRSQDCDGLPLTQPVPLQLRRHPVDQRRHLPPGEALPPVVQRNPIRPGLPPMRNQIGVGAKGFIKFGLRIKGHWVPWVRFRISGCASFFVRRKKEIRKKMPN